MQKAFRFLFPVLAVALAAGISGAETIELVTYYPATAGGDLCTETLKVGEVYCPENLTNGQALILGPLGVGAGFSAAQPPTETLEIAGNVLANGPAASDALFIADRPGDVQLGGLRLTTNGTAQWTFGSRNDGTEDLHLFSDADTASRLIVAQGSGNVGIGVTPASLGGAGNPKIVSVHNDGAGGYGYLGLSTDQTSANSPAGVVEFGTSGVAVGGDRRSASIQSMLTADSAANVKGDLRFYTNNGAGAKLRLRMTSEGNAVVPTDEAPFVPQAPAPNGLTGNLDVNDLYIRSANRWASQGGGGPEFITPVNLTVTAGGWRTINVASSVPAGATSIIAWVVCINTTGGGYSTILLQVRKDSSSPAYYAAHFVAPVNQGLGNMVTIPLKADRTFQYTLSISGPSAIGVTLYGYNT